MKWSGKYIDPIDHYYGRLSEAQRCVSIQENLEHNGNQVKAIKALLKREMEDLANVGVVEEFIDNVVIRIEDNELIIEE